MYIPIDREDGRETMHKINSSMTQRLIATPDFLTLFGLQTPCISNFPDFDFSPMGIRGFLEQPLEDHHHQQQQRVEEPNYPPQQQEQHRQQRGDIHQLTDYYRQNHHRLDNQPQPQNFQRSTLLNPMTQYSVTTKRLSVDMDAGNYLVPEFQRSSSQISPSYSRSTLTLNKQLPFEEFNQLLLDIEHEKDEDDNSDNSENEGDTNHNTNSHIPFENSTNNTQLTQHSTRMTSTVTTTVTENLNPSVHDHNNLTIIKNKTNIPAKSSSFNNQVKTSRPSNDFEKNNLQGRLSIQNANNNTQTQSSKLFSSKSIKGKLEIKFLLDQDDIIQDISKYGKVAKTIITKCGIPKLFVIRGRVIDTRIQFCQYFKSENVTTTSTTINDLKLLKNKKFRLRFKPFTSFGGICTPAIGYNDPMQIPNILLRQEQLCFIQAVQQENNVTYKKLDDGYLVMEIDLHSFCNIFHLVFPFLNSKCPSTWKKDVHITVTLIDENDTEFASAEFEVVSCASPIRDARRYQQRQHIAELEYAEKRLERTVCCDLPSDWDQSGQQTSKSSTKISISDISPNSSGFGSLYSPLPPSMTSEEDRVNELQIYLSRPDTSTPSHIFPDVNADTTNNNDNSSSGGDGGDADDDKWAFVLSPTTSSEVIDSPGVNRMESLKDKHHIGHFFNSHHQESLLKQTNDGLNGKMNLKTSTLTRSVKRSTKEINNESHEEEEYVIKTKSRRIYQILSLLNRELSKHL